MPSIKLIKISKDINVGVASIEEFLEKKGIANAKGPNSRISPDIAVECLKELGKSLSEQDKKRLIALYTADPKSSKKASESVSTSAPKETRKPTEQVKSEKEKLVKVEVPDELKPSLETKGFIDLDKLNKGSSSKKVTKKADEVGAKVSSVSEAKPSKEEPVASEEPKIEKTELSTSATKKAETPTAKESVKESPKDTVKKSVETDKMPEDASRVESKKIKEDISKEKVKKDRSVSDAKPSSSEAAQSSKLGETSKSSEKAETKAADKSGAKEEKSAEKSILSSAEKESDEKVFRLDHEDEDKPGLKILGKIDLSTVDTSTTASRRKRKKAAEGERKKRKRINKQKVDISKEGSAKDGRARDGKSKRTSDRKKGGDNQPKVGRKQKRSAAKKEVSQEEIQKQIKETLQQMQNQKRRGSTAAKYRKDKRDAHRREQDEMDRASEDNKTLRLTEYVTANDLSSMMEVPVNDIISLCFNMGIMVSINQRLDKDTIDLILEEYGFVPEYVGMEMIEAITDHEEDKEEDLLPRAPIVTVMGHVDHGKTSLLDNIRSTNVIAGEAGGITQHVGAYSVSLKDGRKITFLDTPGHEAFTAMRARGAKVTDIVIVVIAADDGVKPQTVEAINHASIAGVPIVFAINKIDRQEANPDKIKEELANLNYLVEDWGGKYQSQNISAKGNIGIDELLEKVLLEAELLDLKANPNKKALGTVIESTLEHGRGYTTKVLVREGTLRVGDHILSGIYHGRVKALFNERGQNVDEVGPATPVKVLGLNGAAQAGDAVNVMDSEQEARDIASKREQLQREQKERMHKIPTLQSLGERIKEGNIQELNVIVKGDVDGSVEALSGSIEKLSTDKVRVRVIHKAVGQISDSDVVLAAASDAVIIGFQVRPSGSAKKIAENEGVEIRTYSVIYTALDEVKAAMEGMLEPEFEETVVANLEVRETFNISKVGTIAGCIVKEGKVSRNSNVRLIRDGIVIYTGHLASLKRFKDDVKEVGNGYECGLNLENFNDIAVGDLIEAYEEVEVKKKL